MFGAKNPSSRFLGRLRESTRGAVAVIGALSLTSMIGMGAMAVEATRGYSAKVTNQRVADAAALAGALAYNVNNSTTQMTATAKAVVVAQGLSANDADVQLVADGARQLVQVTVTTTVPLALGKVLTNAVSYDVAAVGSATATTVSASPPCVAALNGSPTNSITMSGGTSLGAPGCAINSAAGVSLGGGAQITSATQVNSGKSIGLNGGASITTNPTANNTVQNKSNAVSDWMGTNSSLKDILCQVNKLTGTSDSDYADGNTNCASPLITAVTNNTAPDLDLKYNPTGTLASYYSNGTYTIPASWIVSNYPNGIKTLTVQGGITATIQGPLSLSINTLDMKGGTNLTIGSGNITIGSKIDLSGGSNLYFDVGVGNTTTIGKDSAGNSISIAGGSRVCFTLNCVAPTAAAGTFSVAGNIDSQGGTTIVFPKAATHVIGGDLALSGSSILGSGNYIIKGDFTNNTGGTMSGVDVTFALGGTFTLSGGTSLDLAAPGESSSYGIPGVLIATKSASDTRIGGGSSNKYAGLLYAPNSDMTVSGGGSISTNGGACMMLIVKTLTLSGGGALSTGACSGLSASSTTASVALAK